MSAKVVTLYFAYNNEHIDTSNPVRIISAKATVGPKRYTVQPVTDPNFVEASYFRGLVGERIPLDHKRVKRTPLEALEALQVDMQREFLDKTDAITQLDRALRHVERLKRAASGNQVVGS